jgi:hypothetical protein
VRGGRAPRRAGAPGARRAGSRLAHSAARAAPCSARRAPSQAAPLTMATAAFVWKGVALVGSFWLFWCAYFTTLAVGIGGRREEVAGV